MQKIAVIPIDNRPICYDLIKDVLEIKKDIELFIPPINFLGGLTDKSDIEGIFNFIKNLPQIDCLIVSLDTIAYGGLVFSRRCVDSFDEIKVCIAYKDCRNDKVYTSYPTDVFIHKYLEPIYETLPGWERDLTGIRSYEDLPENAKKYIARVEDLIGAPIGIISVGPDREQTILLQK